MGSRRALWMVTITAAACGRFQFDPVDDGATPSDAPAEVPADAPVDVPVDVPVGAFCATLQPAPTFCQDFEQGVVVAADPGPNASIEPVESNTGALSLSSSAFAGNGALEAAFVNIAPGDVAQASVAWTTTAVAHKVTLDYYLNIAERPTAGHLECMSVTVRAPGVGVFYYDLNLVSAPPDHFLQELDPETGAFMAGDVMLGTALSAGAWHHVVMQIDLDASTHTFTVDGVVLHSGANSFTAVPGTISLDTGINWVVDATTPNHILVDNVALYLE